MQDIKDDKYLKILGEQIRILRKSRNMTQLDLAVRMNNFSEQIGRIERGKVNVSVCMLKKISDALEITMSELFDFEIIE
jgi:transcriptional regulator with XRE-family HTH domain